MRPSGANRMFVGWVRPEKATVSVKPVGSAAAAGGAVATEIAASGRSATSSAAIVSTTRDGRIAHEFVKMPLALRRSI